MNDHVTIPREEYDRLVIAAEELADTQAVHEFLTDPRPGLPSAYVIRMLDGESLLRLWREHRGLSQSQLATL